MPAADGLLLADGEDDGAVQRQGRDCGPARRSQGHDPFAVPAEVLSPDLRPRVEKRDLLARVWISRRLVRPFPQRTRDTRQRQVVGRGWPTGGARNNVVDVKRRFLPKLGQLTIFAA